MGARSMGQNRREFLKRTGALGALALGGPLTAGVAAAAGVNSQGGQGATEPAADRPRGITRQMILLNMRRNGYPSGQYRLAAKTQWGILDVAEAGKCLHMHAPS